ncbi:MAG: hypothetical protein CL923_11180, partial [Deltaproteobacteria bacterium]|nr:hypothetical protein [Deltaproteobacteria bacterium]
DWGKTVKKLILNNIFIDHSVRFLTDFTISLKLALLIIGLVAVLPFALGWLYYMFDPHGKKTPSA